MSNSLNCAIIGAGSIGGLIDTPNNSNIASHAHAILVHPACTLKAICEPNKNNEDEFKKRWGDVHSYKGQKELLEKEIINLLIIASPTKYHAQNLYEALQNKHISHILCEKPLTLTFDELKELKQNLLNSNKKILINLMRRYDPSFIKIANDITLGKFGKPLHFQSIFTKGLLHNGIHALGVLSHFFGEVQEIKNIDTRYKNEDLSGDFYVKFKNMTGILSCMRDATYSVFELIVFFENAKIEIKEGGAKIDIFIKKPSPLYEGYYILEHKETMPNTMQHYALNSLKFLLQNDDVTCKMIFNEHINLHEKIFEILVEGKR